MRVDFVPYVNFKNGETIIGKPHSKEDLLEMMAEAKNNTLTETNIGVSPIAFIDLKKAEESIRSDNPELSDADVKRRLGHEYTKSIKSKLYVAPYYNKGDRSIDFSKNVIMIQLGKEPDVTKDFIVTERIRALINLTDSEIVELTRVNI